MSRFWAVAYRLRDAREGIARNAWASIATVVLISLTLVLFGGFLWVNSNLGQVAAMLERQVNVRVFPAEGVAAETLIKVLEDVTNVEAVELVPGTSVFRQLVPVFGEETLLSALPPNAFSDSLSLELAVPERGGETVTELGALPGVGDVVWGQGFAERLYQIAAGLQRMGTGLIIGFLSVATLTSVTAMHLAILNRQSEIDIQGWVGVTPWGIGSQFLVEAVLLGTLASLIAGALFLYLGEEIQQTIVELIPFAENELRSPRLVIGIVLLTGPFLGLIGGVVAARTFIKAHQE